MSDHHPSARMGCYLTAGSRLLTGFSRKMVDCLRDSIPYLSRFVKGLFGNC